MSDEDKDEIKQPWSWYRNNIAGDIKLPSNFYFDVLSDFFAPIKALWMPNDWFEKTETVNNHNRQYDAPVSNFSINGDNHQYRSEREREVTTNSYWYNHRDKLNQYQEK